MPAKTTRTALRVASILIAGFATLIFTGCSAKTTPPATNRTSTSALLRATVTWDEQDKKLTWWFEKRRKLGPGDWTNWNSIGSKLSYTNLVNGAPGNSNGERTIYQQIGCLTPSTTYQYRLAGFLTTANGGTVGTESDPVYFDKTGTTTDAGGDWASFTTEDASATPQPPSGPPYSPLSPFRTPIPNNPAIDSRSDDVVNTWVDWWEQTEHENSAPGFKVGKAGDPTFDWDHPIYYATADDPLYKIEFRPANSDWGDDNGANGEVIHIPGCALPSGSGNPADNDLNDDPDNHMTVISPDGLTEYDFWKADAPAAVPGDPTVGKIRAQWGGKTPTGGLGFSVGATESRFGLMAGVITPEELRGPGEINHALFMVMPKSDGTNVYPARELIHNASNVDSDWAPFGARFYLTYTDAEIDAKSWPDWKKKIIRAAAHYGFYFGDTGGGSLKVKSGVSYTSLGQSDPWVAFAESKGIQETNGYYKFDLTTGGVNWEGKTEMLAPLGPGL